MSDKDWKSKREKKLLVLSPTQFEKWQLCKRKWWLASVRHLPDPPRGFQVFGTVLHAVCERFYSADELGRGPDGKEVNLYPLGWHIAPPKFGNPSEGEIGIIEQSQVRGLINAAISAGVLQRRPDLVCEYQFRRQIGRGTVEGVRVDLTGFIDVLLPDTVEDHKTTKAMRYAKSPEALKKNTQMILYAAELLCVRQELDLPAISHLTLRHNVYCTNLENPEVRKTEAVILVRDVLAFGAEVKEMAVQMVGLRKNANSWHDCPQPTDSYACNAYGGCAYQRICTGEESEESYEKRLALYLSTRYSSQTGTESSIPSTGKDTNMGASDFAKKLAERKAAAAAAETPTATPPAEAAAPPPVEAPAASTALAADGSTPPPWAIEGCAACKGNGFNTQGNACRICDIKSQKAGKSKSQDFSFDSSEPGMVIWQHKTDPNLAGISPLPGSLAPAPKTTERASKPPAAPAEAPKAETQTPPPAPAEIPATEPAATGKGPGRPRKGFIFCVNCTPCTGEGREGSGRAIHRLDKYLLEAQTKLAADGGKESFYELDAFKRRDALAAMIPAFADAFGSDIVVALGVRNGTEMATLVDGLRPLAGMEIIAAM